jgi:hypothetical protein
MTPDDDRLLDDLRRVLSAADPVPAHVSEAARLAFDWRTVDDELAELLYDSSTETEHAGVRSEDRTRVLNFAGEHVRLEVEVSGEGGDRTLTGQLEPVGPARIEIRHADRVDTVAVDDQGRFIARGVPTGNVSLRCLLDAPARALVTPWLPL